MLAEKMATHHVSRGVCKKETYRGDLSIARYVSTSIRRLKNGDMSVVSVCMNHIITFLNCFDMSPAIDFLYARVDEDCKPLLTAYLRFLGKPHHGDICDDTYDVLVARYPLNNTNMRKSQNGKLPTTR